MKDNRRWLALIGACWLAIFLPGCSFLPMEEGTLAPPLLKPVKENFEIYEVKRGTVIRKISGIGIFTADQIEYLYFKESGGRLVSMDVQLGDTVKKGDVVGQISAGDLETRILQQKIALEKAEIALEQAKGTHRGDVQALRLKMLDVESVQVQINLLEEQLSKTKLISEINGIVTYVDAVKPGDSISAWRSLVTISDPDDIKLIYQVSNLADLIGVEINMDVDVQIKGESYKGKVVQIPATAPFNENKSIQDRNARSIIVDVEGLPSGIKIGSSADLTIVTQQREDVLVIPRVGLRTYMGRDYVQVLEGESRKEVDVEKGVMSATEVEIRLGLKEGQKVILNN